MSTKFGVIGTLDNLKQTTMPQPPFVIITLDSYSNIDDNIISLSPHLATNKEVDENIDSLIKQLEKLRKKAKAKLTKRCL